VIDVAEEAGDRNRPPLRDFPGVIVTAVTKRRGSDRDHRALVLNYAGAAAEGITQTMCGDDEGASQ
jgi:hypothetical protein